MFRLPTPSCPLNHLDTLDPAGVVAQVLRIALHTPAAWPLLREAMAYRCDPTGGPAAAEGLAELLALWRIHGRRPPRLHAPSDPDRAADEVAIAAALAEIQAGAPDRAARRLEWLFPARAMPEARATSAAVARCLAAAGLHLASPQAARIAGPGRPARSA